MYDFLKKRGWPAVLLSTLIATIAYSVRADYSSSFNELNGAFVSIILSSFTSSTSLVAFLVVVSADDSKWGDVSEFKTYFALGSLIACVSSMLQLGSSFV